jgi:membrane-associated phospholipid phosphatase
MSRLSRLSVSIETEKEHRVTGGRRRGWLVVGLFIVAFAAALAVDVPVSTWVHDSGLAAWMKSRWWVAERVTLPLNIRANFSLIRFPGNFMFTIVACAVMLAVARAEGVARGERLWRKAAIVFLAGIFSGINSPMKWVVGRIRPFHGVPPFELHPFRYGLLHAEAGFSFPSGDASLAFAMAMALSITVPRHRWLWWALAVMVGIERVCENAHYPSDVVAGAALGVGVAVLAKGIVGWVAGK